MTLTLNMLTECLGGYLGVSQTRSILSYWLISILYASSARQSQILQIVKHFEFDLTCDVISDPEDNSIKFPLTKFPDILTLSRFPYSPPSPVEGGGGVRPPGVSKLSVVELSEKKKQRIALDNTRDW